MGEQASLGIGESRRIARSEIANWKMGIQKRALLLVYGGMFHVKHNDKPMDWE